MGLSEFYESRSIALTASSGRPNRMREKRKVDQRGGVAVVPFGMLRCGGHIFRDGYLETMLDQFGQLRFDAHVGEHPAENDLADPAFAEL